MSSVVVPTSAGGSSQASDNILNSTSGESIKSRSGDFPWFSTALGIILLMVAFLLILRYVVFKR